MIGLALAAHAQQPEPQIAGRVVRADNGAPIGGAKVVLNSGRPNAACCIYAMTDRNGKYSFQDVTDGDYIIAAVADGFLAGDYGLDQNAPYADRRQRVSASTRLHIDFQLLRPASISGVVVNPDGTPARQGVSVTPIRVRKRPDGSPIYSPAGSGGTIDADGHFVINQLYPDTYLVCVNCAAKHDPTSTTGALASFGDLGPTFYGDTDSADAALRVPVKEGEERDGVRIVAKPMKLYSVTIRPIGPEGGPAPQSYGMHLWEIPPSAKGQAFKSFIDLPPLSIGQSAEDQADGSYLFRNVRAGSYRLFGYATSRPHGRGEEFGEGEAELDVTDANVTLPMKMGGYGSVRGSATWEGQPGPSTGGAVLIMDWVQTDPLRGSSPRMASTIDRDGSFLIANILPGTYVFNIDKKSSGVVLQSVRCNGSEVTAAAPLRIGDRQQVTGCQVILKKTGN